MNYLNKITLLLLINLLPGSLEAAAKVNTAAAAEVPTSAQKFDLTREIYSLLHSSEAQMHIRAHKEAYLTCLKALKEDPSYFNATNNALVESRFPLFKIINNLIDQNIEWSFISKLDLEPQKLALINQKKVMSPEDRAKLEEEYHTVFRTKAVALSSADFNRVREVAIRTAGDKFHSILSSIVHIMPRASGVSIAVLQQEHK